MVESNFFGEDHNEQWHQQLEADRQAKQNYLWTEVAQKGFDTSEFAQYMEYKKRKSLLV
jgi:hypothetical protein